MASGFVGIGVDQLLLTGMLTLLAAASAVTVVQRILVVRRQLATAEPDPTPRTG